MEQDVKMRFIEAVKALQGNGVTNLEIAQRTGIDRRNLLRLVREPEKHTVPADWCAALCRHFGVSPKYLMLASGGVFGRGK